jgi:hypothetical protein
VNPFTIEASALRVTLLGKSLEFFHASPGGVAADY